MLVTYSTTEVARWCGVAKSTIPMWMTRYDNWPAPDVEVRTGRGVVRGWLPSRKQEWERYAAMRANSPGAQLVSQRKDRQRKN